MRYPRLIGAEVSNVNLISRWVEDGKVENIKFGKELTADLSRIYRRACSRRITPPEVVCCWIDALLHTWTSNCHLPMCSPLHMVALSSRGCLIYGEPKRIR